MPSAKHFPLIRTLAGVAVMAGAIMVVLFSGTSSISRENIEAHLGRFGEFMSRQAKEGGKQATFTFGDIEIIGWGYRKEAIVSTVSLELAEPKLLDIHRWLLSTTEMHIRRDPVTSQRLFFVFPEPVNIIENSELKTVITFSAPLTYAFFDGNDHGAHALIHELHLPDQIVLAPAPTADLMGKQGRTVISYSDPLVKARFLPDSHSREITYAFRNLKIADDDGTETLIGFLSSDFGETQDEYKQRVSGHYTLKIDDMVMAGDGQASRPYSLETDVSYSGDAPGEVATLLPNLRNMQMKVNSFILMGEDFKIEAQGSVSTATDDPLPFGNIQVVMENAQRFLLSELLSERVRAPVASALQKITAQPVDKLTRAEFTLKREKNGVFYVGNTTFEELTASLLSDMLKPAAPPLMPPAVLPPAEEPQVETPEELPSRPPAAM